MPVEFLSDEEGAAYGRFGGPPSRSELERVFFLDDADRALIARHRGEYNRLGFALQLTTVRSLGLFLVDPLEVPGVVLDYLAGQLEIADVSCVARYMERRTTRFEHVEEIKLAGGLRDFTEVARELEDWVDARAWTTSDGPKAIFNDAIGWLVDRGVLLPTANARALRRHPRSRRLATLLATVVHLEARATDDCLELLDLLMVTELLGKAERESVKEKARQHPRLARASAKLATAIEVLLDATARGGELGLDEVWELIDAVVSRGELRAAVAAITELVPPDVDDDGVKRAQLATRTAT